MGPRVLLFVLIAPLAGAGKDGAAALEELERKYSIRVVVAPERFAVRWGSLKLITGDVPKETKASSYSELLLAEFGIYPVSFVKKSRLWAIYLCADLRYHGERRTAIPDHRRNILYLDVERARHAERYVRKVIHHEFFHMVDIVDDGELYRDPGWARLNSDTFRYGRGGAAMQRDPDASLPDDSTPGFLNRYSTSGIQEDKAEVFAHMIREYAAVERRAKDDEILRKKVAYMKELLANFCPEINATFWQTRSTP